MDGAVDTQCRDMSFDKLGLDTTVVNNLPGSELGVQVRTTYPIPGATFTSTNIMLPNGLFSLAPGQSYDASSFTVTTHASGPAGTAVEIDFP